MKLELELDDDLLAWLNATTSAMRLGNLEAAAIYLMRHQIQHYMATALWAKRIFDFLPPSMQQVSPLPPGDRNWP